jgi:copine 5/8/9
MGCTQGIENDRNIATANLEFDNSQIEAKKAVEFTLGEKGATSRVELSVSCRKLKTKERIIDGDPFYVAYVSESGGKEPIFQEIKRSEIISKTHAPKWINKITVNYNFEKPQLMKIEVYYCTTSFSSSDTSAQFNLPDHQLLGYCIFSLGDIFGASHQGWFGPILTADEEDLDGESTAGGGQGNNKKRGYMTIQGEELASVSDQIHLRLECKKLKNMEIFGKSDPFLVISKQRDDGSYATCYKSEVMSNNLSPAYEIRSSTLDLANGDINRLLKIEVFDWNSSGHHVYIGRGRFFSFSKSLFLLLSLSLSHCTPQARRCVP